MTALRQLETEEAEALMLRHGLLPLAGPRFAVVRDCLAAARSVDKVQRALTVWVQPPLTAVERRRYGRALDDALGFA